MYILGSLCVGISMLLFGQEKRMRGTKAYTVAFVEHAHFLTLFSPNNRNREISN